MGPGLAHPLASHSSVVHNIHNTSTLLNSSIDPNSQNSTSHRGSQLLQHIAPRIIHSPHSLTFHNILQRHYIQLNPSTIHNRHTRYISRLIRLRQIHNHRPSPVRSLTGIHLQVVDQTVDELLCARDERAVPVLRWANFERDGWDAVVYPSCFDAAGLAGVDFEDVGLGELSEALDARESEVGVGPKGPGGACREGVWWTVSLRLRLCLDSS
jgi:hypothetical protein